MTKKAYVKPEIESIGLSATEKACNCGCGTGSLPPEVCQNVAPTAECECVSCGS